MKLKVVKRKLLLIVLILLLISGAILGYQKKEINRTNGEKENKNVIPAAIVHSGNCGEDYQWRIYDNGHLVIFRVDNARL